jgi:hypothetical protein
MTHRATPAHPPNLEGSSSANWGIRKTNACLDFIEVEVIFSKATSFGAVQRCLDAPLKRSLLNPIYVKATAGPSRSSTAFRFRIQNATPDMVRAAERALTERFQVVGALRLTAVELAVDFYPELGLPQSALEDLACRMAARVYAPSAKPRQVGDLTGRRARRLGGAHDRFLPGCTVYFGHKRDDIMGRLYPKVLDEGIGLAAAEFRVRRENCFKGAALEQFGLHTTEDLFGFDFRVHCAEHFRFRRQRDGLDGLADTSLPSVIAKGRGIHEARGMHVFEGVQTRLGYRTRRFSRLTQADSCLTARAAKALDRLTKLFSNYSAHPADHVQATGRPFVRDDQSPVNNRRQSPD